MICTGKLAGKLSYPFNLAHKLKRTENVMNEDEKYERN